MIKFMCLSPAIREATRRHLKPSGVKCSREIEYGFKSDCKTVRTCAEVLHNILVPTYVTMARPISTIMYQTFRCSVVLLLLQLVIIPTRAQGGGSSSVSSSSLSSNSSISASQTSSTANSSTSATATSSAQYPSLSGYSPCGKCY